MQTVEKWATRSDAWTPQDDERLATLVLEHIRNGSTQLRAFEVAATELGRTAAACGYRWNGVVRKDYRKNIDESKAIRKRLGGGTTVDEPVSFETSSAPVSVTTSDSIHDVIHFLESFQAEFERLCFKVTELQRENAELQTRVEELESESTAQASPDVTQAQLEEDSRTLVAIMERARKLLGDNSRTRTNS